MEVEEVDYLVEGAPGEGALEALCAAARGERIVACSHGDVLTTIAEMLLRRGVEVEGKVSIAKAARFAVAFDAGGEPERVRFTPPPRTDH